MDICDAFERVRQDDIGKHDHLVNVHEITMQHGRIFCPGADDDGFGFALSPWAQAQACTRLGIPTGYFAKCPTELQDRQFNHWVQEGKPERWTVRAKDARVRAVLSERYERLDNRHLFEALLPAIDGGQYQVKLFEITPESLHLRLIDPRLSRLALPGDPLMVAIHVANSEVGLRAVTIDAAVYRQVCSNGAVRRIAGKSLLRQRHIHLTSSQFVPLLQEAIGQASAVAAAFMEQMILSTKIAVPNPERAIQILADTWKLPRQTVEYIRFGLFGERYAETMYGLLNAVTNAAQRLPVDSRFELETLAAVLIDTSDSSREASQLRERILSPRALTAA